MCWWGWLAAPGPLEPQSCSAGLAPRAGSVSVLPGRLGSNCLKVRVSAVCFHIVGIWSSPVFSTSVSEIWTCARCWWVSTTAAIWMISNCGSVHASRVFLTNSLLAFGFQPFFLLFFFFFLFLICNWYLMNLLLLLLFLLLIINTRQLQIGLLWSFADSVTQDVFAGGKSITPNGNERFALR